MGLRVGLAHGAAGTVSGRGWEFGPCPWQPRPSSPTRPRGGPLAGVGWRTCLPDNLHMFSRQCLDYEKQTQGLLGPDVFDNGVHEGNAPEALRTFNPVRLG